MRRLLLGIVLSFLVALAVGPAPFVVLFWLAVVALWQTGLMLPLAASPQTLDDWRRWVQGRTPRRLSWLVYAPLLILVASEAGLRIERLAGETPWRENSLLAELPAVNDLPAAQPLDLSRLKAGRFRVAVLGDRPDSSENLSQRVAQVLPGAEIVPLATSRTEADAAERLAAEVDELNPDLVLAMLAVCEDLAREPARRSPFDWRQLELAKRIVGEPPVEQPVRRLPADDFESFLGEMAPQLVACRTPINDGIRARWRRVYTSLDGVIAGCRQAQVPLALVVVPGEFQVNAELRETLLRRNGLSSEQFDVELPQRQLAGFAQHRKTPLIDLLPPLRLCREAVYERNALALNDEGHEAAASAISGWLHSRYGGQLTAQLSKAP